ncbi:MAG: hypothetical protein WEA04_02435 [Candidatus Andersenbacteria bacterium]
MKNFSAPNANKTRWYVVMLTLVWQVMQRTTISVMSALTLNVIM